MCTAKAQFAPSAYDVLTFMMNDFRVPCVEQSLAEVRNQWKKQFFERRGRYALPYTTFLAWLLELSAIGAGTFDPAHA
jgi:hypothetical protein